MNKAGVKCADCGFLTGRNPESAEYVEVDRHPRESGVTAGVLQRINFPVCLLGANDLQRDLSNQPGQAESKVRVLAVLNRERACDEFCKWRPGFTPRGHVEMVQTALLKQEIEERRLADERRAEERRKADEERAEQRRREDRAWQVGQEDKRYWRGVYQALFVGVFTVTLGAVITILAEPWKSKSEPAPPTVIVNLPTEAFKK
jgi:hypothetical protein